MDEATRAQIQQLVSSQPIVLFMKGTKTFPQCGFSATVVEVLKRLNADFEGVNVLQDPAVREGIKEFANWPTIPQLYVGGKFVGGCDIVRDMFMAGELEPLVNEALGRPAAAGKP
jgi:monothiol glutaredoxin